MSALRDACACNVPFELYQLATDCLIISRKSLAQAAAAEPAQSINVCEETSAAGRRASLPQTIGNWQLPIAVKLVGRR